MSDINAISVSLDYLKEGIDELKKDVRDIKDTTIKNQQKIWFLEKVIYGGFGTIVIAGIITALKGV